MNPGRNPQMAVQRVHAFPLSKVYTIEAIGFLILSNLCRILDGLFDVLTGKSSCPKGSLICSKNVAMPNSFCEKDSEPLRIDNLKIGGSGLFC